MRIDLIETGAKDIDIEFNGKKLDGVVWADDVTGECEVFEQHWFTQERLTDENGPMGYQTMKLKGVVKINDRRPQSQPSLPHTDYPACDPYGGMCILRVLPSRTSPDPHRLQILDLAGTLLHESEIDLAHGIRAFASMALQRLAKYSFSHVEVDIKGLGCGVLAEIKKGTAIPVYPL